MNKQNCPICNTSENFYIDTLDNKTQKICFHCGFFTNDNYQVNSEATRKFDEHNSKLITDLKFIDMNGYVWYPLIIDADNGMIFPDGTDKDNWSWAVAGKKIIPVMERINYPKPGKENEFYEIMLDMDNINHFNKFDYHTAAKYLSELKIKE